MRIILMAFLLLPAIGWAQKGKYIQPLGGYQLARLSNSDDFYSTNNGQDQVNWRDTWRPAFGIEYINNFQDGYGYSVGVIYSQQGQKYFGQSQFLNPPVTAEWESRVYMDYLKFPLLFRFNSIMESNDVVGVSLMFGLQPSYLTSVNGLETRFTTVYPDGAAAPPDSTGAKYSGYDLKSLYRSLDLGLVGGAQMNFRISPRFTAAVGVRYDRSIYNIEKTKTKLPSDFPTNLIFPLSVPKPVRPGAADLLRRDGTLNNVVNFFVCLQVRISDGGAGE